MNGEAARRRLSRKPFNKNDLRGQRLHGQGKLAQWNGERRFIGKLSRVSGLPYGVAVEVEGTFEVK